MSRQNVEVVQRWIASLNASEEDALQALTHREIEWRDLMHEPDVPEVLHGVAALEQLAAQWQGAYESLTAEVIEYIDVHPWVICRSRWVAKTREGMAVEVRSFDAYEVEDGQIRRSWGGYPDLHAAHKALGLGE